MNRTDVASPPTGLRHLETRFTVNLDRISSTVNAGAVVALAGAFLLGRYVSFYVHFLTVALVVLNAVNFYWRHVQKRHTLLANYGFPAQVRYLLESVGPEFRQYLFASDSEERPFSVTFGVTRDCSHPYTARHAESIRSRWWRSSCPRGPSRVRAACSPGRR